MKPILVKQLSQRQVYIWGARIVGIGLSRDCINSGINVISFVDSDSSLHGKSINNIPVISPSALYETIQNKLASQDISIVVAVSIKEAEITKEIKANIFSNYKNNLKVLPYSNYFGSFYTIDVVGSCNLRCASCAHSIQDNEMSKGHISFDDVKSIIDKIQLEDPGTTHVSLYSWGEPLIHPRLPDIIDLFHTHGIAVGISTNLSHENFSKVEAMIRSNPDYLKISLSGFYEDAYNSTHQGGNIALVKSNMYRLRYFINKHRASTLVDINYHLYRNNNQCNLIAMTELSKELDFGLSTVHALVMPLERVIDYCEGAASQQTNELQTIMGVTISEGIEASKSIKIGDTCPFRENQLNINSDLSVPVCCTVYSKDNLVSQNYLKTPLKTINQQKQTMDICKKCMSYDLPQYNMGFNRINWDKKASEKPSLDLLK